MNSDKHPTKRIGEAELDEILKKLFDDGVNWSGSEEPDDWWPDQQILKAKSALQARDRRLTNALLEKIEANSPKDRNHPHKMFSNDLVEAYADGYDKANAQWRALLRRYRVGKGEL